MRKRSIAFLLVLVFLLTLSPFAFAATSGGYSYDPSAVGYDPGYNGTVVRPDPSNPAPGPHQHNWSRYHTSKPATCIEEGERYTQCEDCGERHYETTPKTPHPFGEWYVVKEPTPEEPGYEQHVCSYCGLIETRDLYIDGTRGPETPVNTPRDPNNPGDPNDPRDPNNPGDPNDPRDPNDPSDPNDPGGAASDVSLVKSVVNGPKDERGYQLGEEIQYYIGLENLSSRPLQNVQLFDYMSGAPLATSAYVDAYGSLSGVFTYFVTQDDLSAGEVRNIATAKWVFADNGEPGSTLSNEVVVDVLDLRESGLSITKTRLNEPMNGSFFTPGEVIHYQISVTNTGELDLFDATVCDMLKTEASGELGSIEIFHPGETRYFSFDYEVDWNDAENGWLENDANVAGMTEKGEMIYALASDWTLTGFNEPMISVKKEVVSTPKNGSYYVLGEQVDFFITIRNLGNMEIENCELDDCLDYAYYYCLDPGFTLMPGEMRSYTYSATVSQEDVDCGWMVNAAILWGWYTDGNQCFAYDEITVPAGKPDANPRLSVTKKAISAPKNGSYYVLDEKVDFVITVSNTGNVAVDSLGVYDWPSSYGDWTYLDSNITLMPGESLSYFFTMTVKQDDIDNGWAGNFAWAKGWFSSGLMAYSEDYITVPAGKPGNPSFTVPGGGKGEGDYCRNVLGDFSENSRTSELDYCAEHAALAEQISKLGAVPGMTEEKVADAALKAWRDAVDKEVEELAARGNADFAVLVKRAQEAWSAWCESEKAELRLRGLDETAVTALLAEQARQRCAWLCYLNGAGTEQRPDSYLSGSPVAASAQEPAACTRVQSMDGELVTTTEVLCAQHAALEAGLGQTLQGGKIEPLALFTMLKQRWLMAMSAQNQASLAAGGDESIAVTQERAAFGRLLAAEEQMLAVIYSEHPETVQELLTQSVRAHVIDRCTA